ncbi:hypothetical protein AB0J30_08875 [Streptomyces microflavus]|uniref:hypothetical protein n=1 Tax=Streptomyces microflavus TaxID=1919 RepID=UPI003431FE8A
MSGRSLRGRLAALADKVPAQALDAAECRFHGQDCNMGRTWPVKALKQDVELRGMIWAARIRTGRQEPGVDPYTLDVHDPLTTEEVTVKRREAKELIAEAKAKAAIEEAAIIDEEAP